MNIKTKLRMNIALVLIAVGSVVLTGVLGMGYVQKNLTYLVKRSTPFQTRTTGLQEALQQANADFVKVSACRTHEEYAKARREAEQALAEVKRREEGLESLVGSDGHYSVYADLSGTAQEVFGISDRRLKAEEEADAARRAITAGMEQTSALLGNLSASMKRLQHDRFSTFSASLDTTRSTAIVLRDIETFKLVLNDLLYSMGDLQKAQDRKALLLAKSRYNVALGKVRNSEYLRHSRKVSEETRKLAEGVDEMIRTKSAAKGADEAKEKESPLSADLGERTALILLTIDQEVKAARERYQREDANQGASFAGANQAIAVLTGNSEVLAAGLAVDGLTTRLFTATSDQEIGAIEAELQRIFNRLPPLRRDVQGRLAKLKASKELATERLAGESLAKAQQFIFSGDGIIAKVRKLHVMRAEAGRAVAALHGIVGKVADKGSKEMTAAQLDQEKAIASVTTLIASSKAGMLIMGLAALVVGVFFAISLERSVTRPVRALNKMAEAFGNGDFTQRLDDSQRNEFGELAANFNQATLKIREMSGQIFRVIDYLASHSQQLADTACGLTRGARDQTIQTEQSSQAMGEMSQTVAEVALNASAAAETTREALGTAAAGNQAVECTVQGMRRIASFVDESTGLIRKLGASSEQIESIVTVINGIAEQTNLLALNASIEAARAGSFGLGFAVVADEVRTLARRTTESTRDIETTIREIQTVTSNSITAMEKGGIHVQEGVALAEKARQTLSEIVAATSRGADTVERIAAAAEEQSVTVQQVSANVAKIAQITRLAENDTDDIMRSSAQLKEHAEELCKVAAWFKVGEAG